MSRTWEDNLKPNLFIVGETPQRCYGLGHSSGRSLHHPQNSQAPMRMHGSPPPNSSPSPMTTVFRGRITGESGSASLNYSRSTGNDSTSRSQQQGIQPTKTKIVVGKTTPKFSATNQTITPTNHDPPIYHSQSAAIMTSSLTIPRLKQVSENQHSSTSSSSQSSHSYPQQQKISRKDSQKLSSNTLYQTTSNSNRQINTSNTTWLSSHHNSNNNHNKHRNEYHSNYSQDSNITTPDSSPPTSQIGNSINTNGKRRRLNTTNTTSVTSEKGEHSSCSSCSEDINTGGITNSNKKRIRKQQQTQEIIELSSDEEEEEEENEEGDATNIYIKEGRENRVDDDDHYHHHNSENHDKKVNQDSSSPQQRPRQKHIQDDVDVDVDVERCQRYNTEIQESESSSSSLSLVPLSAERKLQQPKPTTDAHTSYFEAKKHVDNLTMKYFLFGEIIYESDATISECHLQMFPGIIQDNRINEKVLPRDETDIIGIVRFHVYDKPNHPHRLDDNRTIISNHIKSIRVLPIRQSHTKLDLDATDRILLFELFPETNKILNNKYYNPIPFLKHQTVGNQHQSGTIANYRQNKSSNVNLYPIIETFITVIGSMSRIQAAVDQIQRIEVLRKKMLVTPRTSMDTALSPETIDYLQHTKLLEVISDISIPKLVPSIRTSSGNNTLGNTRLSNTPPITEYTYSMRTTRQSSSREAAFIESSTQPYNTRKQYAVVDFTDEKDHSMAASVEDPRDKEVYAVYPIEHNATDCVTIYRGDLKRLQNNVYLNDSLIDFQIHYIMKHLPQHRQEKAYRFSSLFYTELTSGGSFSYDNVKSWTKGINLFEKDFVLVPINQHNHWSLVVIVRPALVIENESEVSIFPKKLKRLIRNSTTPRSAAKSTRVTRTNSTQSTSSSSSNHGENLLPGQSNSPDIAILDHDDQDITIVDDTKHNDKHHTLIEIESDTIAIDQHTGGKSPPTKSRDVNTTSKKCNETHTNVTSNTDSSSQIDLSSSKEFSLNKPIDDPIHITNQYQNQDDDDDISVTSVTSTTAGKITIDSNQNYACFICMDSLGYHKMGPICTNLRKYLAKEWDNKVLENKVIQQQLDSIKKECFEDIPNSGVIEHQISINESHRQSTSDSVQEDKKRVLPAEHKHIESNTIVLSYTTSSSLDTTTTATTTTTTNDITSTATTNMNETDKDNKQHHKKDRQKEVKLYSIVNESTPYKPTANNMPTIICKVPTQTNGYDCGVFTCKFAEYITGIWPDSTLTLLQDKYASYIHDTIFTKEDIQGAREFIRHCVNLVSNEWHEYNRNRKRIKEEKKHLKIAQLRSLEDSINSTNNTNYNQLKSGSSENNIIKNNSSFSGSSSSSSSDDVSSDDDESEVETGSKHSTDLQYEDFMRNPPVDSYTTDVHDASSMNKSSSSGNSSSGNSNSDSNTNKIEKKINMKHFITKLNPTHTDSVDESNDIMEIQEEKEVLQSPSNNNKSSMDIPTSVDRMLDTALIRNNINNTTSDSSSDRDIVKDLDTISHHDDDELAQTRHSNSNNPSNGKIYNSSSGNIDDIENIGTDLSTSSHQESDTNAYHTNVIEKTIHLSSHESHSHQNVASSTNNNSDNINHIQIHDSGESNDKSSEDSIDDELEIHLQKGNMKRKQLFSSSYSSTLSNQIVPIPVYPPITSQMVTPSSSTITNNVTFATTSCMNDTTTTNNSNNNFSSSSSNNSNSINNNNNCMGEKITSTMFEKVKDKIKDHIIDPFFQRLISPSNCSNSSLSPSDEMSSALSSALYNTNNDKRIDTKRYIGSKLSTQKGTSTSKSHPDVIDLSSDDEEQEEEVNREESKKVVHITHKSNDMDNNHDENQGEDNISQTGSSSSSSSVRSSTHTSRHKKKKTLLTSPVKTSSDHYSGERVDSTINEGETKKKKQATDRHLTPEIAFKKRKRL